ncbi:hypothetical protein L486_08340 [Kwoniella mangroviensis CBS 10435]|uniref:Uncharacterized protein n=1 Tax=Kwoniella mangroviensis CBS 10435 TaxID=1331196 RepID=A0A1B9IFD2_9TREE|nr:hypothetical protein L486_08340 [Kwoniella mangroviensis CBS 10435]
MGNNDPTSEFMYQIPLQGFNNKSLSEGGFGLGLGLGGNNSERGGQPLDLKALNERLQTLGLGGPSIDSLGTSIPRQPPPTTTENLAVHTQATSAVSPSPTRSQNAQSQLGSGFRTNHSLSPNSAFQQPIQAFPSVTELAPGDSISMYRPARAPSTAARSQRRGGTNVDPGETGETPFTPEEAYENAPGDGASYWSQDDITARSPRTGAGGLEDEALTIGPTSVWTRGDMGRDMYDHRDRLLRQESNRNQEHMEELQRQIREAQNLATTATKLEAAEKQLRELQARLIAEQVARTQIEQEAGLKEEEMKNYQNEWASAVRALRRARDEGEKSDEEKRRIQRCFEEARDKLWKYHEALRVREARAQGKEEGRAEAWQEAERWMGSSPPIPGVEPVQMVPGAVLHQTPMMQTQTPLFLQSPTNQYFQQAAQQPQQQYQQPPPQGQQQQAQQQQWQGPVSPGNNAPMQSIAQLMEYFAQNPGAFPQFQQGQQHISPPQQISQPQTQQQMPSQQPASVQLPPMAQSVQPPPSDQIPTTQTPGQSMAPMPHQTPGQTAPSLMPQQTGAPSQYPGAASQFMHPQPTGQSMMPQHTGQPSVVPMMPQHTGQPMMQPQSTGQPMIFPQPTGQVVQPQHIGAPTAKQPTPPQPTAIPQPMMVPVMVPIAQTTPMVVPGTIPVSVGQLPPNQPTQTHTTVPAYTQPTIPPQPPTMSQRTPRAPATAINTTTSRNKAPASTRTQATRLPPANRTGVSTVPQVPHPESVHQPHAADSYLERFEHDPDLKKMMGGARSKTIHSSAVPPSITEHSRAPTQPHTAARSTFDDSASNVDKPLPNSFPPSQVSGRSHTHRTPSTIRPSQSANNSQKMARRMSLSDGLHNSHAIRMSQIPDGDRYPAFPIGGNHQGRTHSRNTSYGSVDPAGIGLPPDVSNVQSPTSEYRRGGRSSARQTPIRSGRTSARSRVAGALRNDMDLDSELPGIQEDEEEEMQRHGHAQVPPPMMHPNDNGMPPSQIMRQIPSASARGPPRAPPSMPSMRHRINPVMPQPLGGGPPPLAGPNKTFSEPHPTRVDRGHKSHHSLSALFHHRDPAGARSEHLPEPESVYHPPKTHDLFVPPSLGPVAVSGGVEDVQGPRTSALGLSGVGSDDGRMRAPTSSHSRSNHPTSAYFPPSPKTPRPPQSPARTEVANKGGRQVINLDSPPAPGTTRQTVIITERSDPRPEAHQVPLPKSRSNAPTAYSGMSPEDVQNPRDVPLPPTKTYDPAVYSPMGKEFSVSHRDTYHPPPTNSSAGGIANEAQRIPLPLPRSNAPTAYMQAQGKQPFQFPLPPSRSTAPTAYTTKEPHQVPLPPPKSMAPTAYTTSPPDNHTSSGAGPQVRSIDFANVPLPRGGGTVYDMKTQVTSEPDIDEPRGPSRSATHKTPPPPSKIASTKKSHRKPVPTNGGNGNGNGTEPRMYPLPTSRAPTRGNRASTYAASVPPIEEVTEPESGRENTLVGRQSRLH